MVLVSQLQPARSIHIKELKYLVTYQIKIHILLKKSLKNKKYFVPITGSKMAAAARISLHIHKLVSKKGHWFLKKAKILPKLFESLVNIVTSFVWLRLYWLRLRRRKPLIFFKVGTEMDVIFVDFSKETTLRNNPCIDFNG